MTAVIVRGYLLIPKTGSLLIANNPACDHPLVACASIMSHMSTSLNFPEPRFFVKVVSIPEQLAYVNRRGEDTMLEIEAMSSGSALGVYFRLGFISKLFFLWFA